METIIVGIDGGEWSVVKDLISNNRLPNIRKLINGGTRSELKSTTPPVSPLAWNTIYTGTNPGKHGIYDFSKLEEDYSRTPISAESRSVEPFWRVLNDNGKSTGLFNLPFSYPSGSVDGFMVNGWPLPTTVHDFASPDDVQKEVGSLNRILVNKGFDKGDYSELKDDLFRTAVNQKNTLFSILENHDPDLLFTVFDGLDVAQHFFWKYYDPGHPRFVSHPEYSSVIPDYYEFIDDFIGELQRITFEECNIILLSDHGFRKLHSDIYVDEWLESQDYLKWSDRSVVDRFSQVTSRCIKHIWHQIKEKDHDSLISRVLPEGVFQTIREIGQTNRPIDYSTTSAIFSGVSGQSIYINRGGKFANGNISGEEYEEIMMELCKLIQNLKDPDTGQKVISSIFRGDEVYKGGNVDRAPDIILEYVEGYSLKGGKSEYLKRSSSAGKYDRSGDHKESGLFVAYGPSFKRDEKISMSVKNVAPLLLHLNSAPVPKIMDGTVPKDIFIQDKVDVKYTLGYYEDSLDSNRWTQSESEDIEDRLKDLGYLG